jgi:hypothetical protein
VYIYYVWITALMPSYQDGIIAGLVKRGYMVGPAAKDGKVSVGTDTTAATLFALSVYRTDAETDANKVYTDITEVLKDMKAYYYSVIVSHSYEATWIGSNFSLPAKKKADKVTPPPIPSVPPGTKKNMN